MGRNDNPWTQVAALTGMAALAGAGVGAGSALMFAERRLIEPSPPPAAALETRRPSVGHR